MPAKNQQITQSDPEKQPPHPLTALIDKNVIGALGHPGDLFGVQVRPLWDNHYRVNVLVGGDASSVKVAHSYFLVADGDGNIIASTPKIMRLY